MKTSTYIVELGTEGEDSSPGLALSLLRNRIKGISFHHEGGVLSVGTASDFHLRTLTDVEVSEDGKSEGTVQRMALVCRVEMDNEAHDSIKHLLTDGVQKLWVMDHPILRAVSP